MYGSNNNNNNNNSISQHVTHKQEETVVDNPCSNQHEHGYHKNHPSFQNNFNHQRKIENDQQQRNQIELCNQNYDVDDGNDGNVTYRVPPLPITSVTAKTVSRPELVLDGLKGK